MGEQKKSLRFEEKLSSRERWSITWHKLTCLARLLMAEKRSSRSFSRTNDVKNVATQETSSDVGFDVDLENNIWQFIHGVKNSANAASHKKE